MPISQILQYALLRVRTSYDDDRGEISATTIVWAAALVLLAISVAAILVQKITAKANGISL